MKIHFKLVFIAIILFLVNCQINALSNKAPNSDLIIATEKIDFYSNYWINLHHYLFRIAKNQNTNKAYLSKNKILLDMNNQEKESFTHAIDYYRDHIIKKNLLFNQDMFDLKLALSQKQINQSLDGIHNDEDLINYLNLVSPIYQKLFWSQHDRQNRDTINKYKLLIKSTEHEFLQVLAHLSGQAWPAQKIRIDMSYYANWSEAYTSVKPKIHAVISSLKYKDDFDLIELLWHESSHGIISPNEFKVSEIIEQISQELNIQPPRHLWHGILFYLAGATTQKILAKDGIEYELYMIRYKIFSSQIPYLIKFMQPYVDGRTTMYQAIKDIMLAYLKADKQTQEK